MDRKKVIYLFFLSLSKLMNANKITPNNAVSIVLISSLERIGI